MKLRQKIEEYSENVFPTRHDLAGGRWYQHNGILKPSATTVLGIIDKGAWFYNWVADSRSAKQKSEDAKARGTRVHLNITTLLAGLPIPTSTTIDGEEVEMPRIEAKMLMGFLAWAKEAKPITYANEIILFHEDAIVAGACDWLGTFLYKGKRVFGLIDFKTGKHYSEHHHQLTFYGNLVKKIFHRQPRLFVLRLYEYRGDILPPKYDLKPYKPQVRKANKVAEVWLQERGDTPKIPEPLPKYIQLGMSLEGESDD